MEETLKTLSLDYLYLLINGQAFSDVSFSVEGRLVHAHRCILAARSLFFRKFFCGPDPPPPGLLFQDHHHHHHHHHHSPRSPSASSPRGGGGGAGGGAGGAAGPGGAGGGVVIPVNSVSYEVFLLLLQFLYSGQVSWCRRSTSPAPIAPTAAAGTPIAPPPSTSPSTPSPPPAPSASSSSPSSFRSSWRDGGEGVDRGRDEGAAGVAEARHAPAVGDLLDPRRQVGAAAGGAGEAPPARRRRQDRGAAAQVLPRPPPPHPHPHHHHHPPFLAHHPIDIVGVGVGPSGGDVEEHHHKIRRMRRALDSSDVELVKLMPRGREGAARAGRRRRELPRGARRQDPAPRRRGDGLPGHGRRPARPPRRPQHPHRRRRHPLDILRTLTSDFLFKGAVPGLSHIEPNKLRLCLELVQSAAMVMSREEAAAAAAAAAANSSGGGGANSPSVAMYPNMNSEASSCNANSNSNSGVVNLSLDSRMVYLNLGMAAQLGCKMNEGGDDHESASSRSQSGGGGIAPSSMYSPHGYP
uniref:BTB domain-containing protein n=1 Tax=Ananas comosus var. bracteatus TaxID=296719 RepID=A0A6V7PBT0_ANACO|nr:unnamed protein product [Ananas comosus var. bracteatus]